MTLRRASALRRPGNGRADQRRGPLPNTYQAPGCQQAMTSLDARPSGAALFLGASFLPRLRLSFLSSGSRPWSLHQTPIGDLARSLVLAPCPRNSSVPSLVQSNMIWLQSQLVPGSSKGQSSLEERSSAPHECAEGRRGSNQSDWMSGVVQEAIACFVTLATITDLGISCRSHHLALPLVLRTDSS